MKMLVAAWDGVTTKTVLNCLRKSKISSDGQKAVIVEDNDPFKESEEEIEDPRSVQGDLISENMDAASFTDDDAWILAVEPPPWCWDCSESVGNGVLPRQKRAFANYQDQANIILVFKRWCNCSILCESCCSHNWSTLCGQELANNNYRLFPGFVKKHF